MHSLAMHSPAMHTCIMHSFAMHSCIMHRLTMHSCIMHRPAMHSCVMQIPAMLLGWHETIVTAWRITKPKINTKTNSNKQMQKCHKINIGSICE